MSKHYDGPPPFYGSRIYGRRFILARQFRGYSRYALAARLGLPAHRLREVERAELTTDRDLARRLAWALEFPSRFFNEPPDKEIFKASGFHVCRNPDYTTCACGNQDAPLLCDAPTKDGTCDTPCCPGCSRKRGDLDICAVHP